VRPAGDGTWRDACGGWARERGCDWMPPASWDAGRYEMRVLVRRAGATGIDFEAQSAPRVFYLVEGGEDAAE
jgi:hypothetical protein